MCSKINLAVMSKETEGTEWGPAPSLRKEGAPGPDGSLEGGYRAGLAEGRLLQLSPWGRAHDGPRQ